MNQVIRILAEALVFITMLAIILMYRGQVIEYTQKLALCSNATQQLKTYSDLEVKKDNEIETLKRQILEKQEKTARSINAPPDADCKASFDWMISQVAKEQPYV